MFVLLNITYKSPLWLEQLSRWPLIKTQHLQKNNLLISYNSVDHINTLLKETVKSVLYM